MAIDHLTGEKKYAKAPKEKKQPQPGRGASRRLQAEVYRTQRAAANAAKRLARHAKRMAAHAQHLAQRNRRGCPVRGTARRLRRVGLTRKD